MGATLTGVFLRSHFTYDLFAAEGLAYLPRHEIEAAMTESAAAVKLAADVAEQTLRSAAERAGASFEWRVLDGDSDAALIAAARRADLSIFPRASRPAGEDAAFRRRRSAWPAAVRR